MQLYLLHPGMKPQRGFGLKYGLLRAGSLWLSKPWQLGFAQLMKQLVGLGFADDAAVLAAVVSTVQKHMLPKHIQEARDWLGAENETQDS